MTTQHSKEKGDQGNVKDLVQIKHGVLNCMDKGRPLLFQIINTVVECDIVEEVSGEKWDCGTINVEKIVWLSVKIGEKCNMKGLR